MPYHSISDLPQSQVDQYDRHQKQACLEAFNNAYHEYGGDESRAFAVAHAAAKRAGGNEDRGSSRSAHGSRGRSSHGSSRGGHKVNINKASADELMRVDGIGDRTARNIVNYRSRHGRFQNVDDLDEVEGIGEATLRDIRDHLTT